MSAYFTSVVGTRFHGPDQFWLLPSLPEEGEMADVVWTLFLVVGNYRFVEAHHSFPETMKEEEVWEWFVQNRISRRTYES